MDISIDVRKQLINEKRKVRIKMEKKKERLYLKNQRHDSIHRWSPDYRHKIHACNIESRRKAAAKFDFNDMCGLYDEPDIYYEIDEPYYNYDYNEWLEYQTREDGSDSIPDLWDEREYIFFWNDIELDIDAWS